MIDVDTGVDDAEAIMLALSCPDIEVMAITCVAGNVDIDKVCLNTLKVLKVCERLDVSTYLTLILPLFLYSRHTAGLDAGSLKGGSCWIILSKNTWNF